MTWYEKDDQYTLAVATPPELLRGVTTGPAGLALVDVYGDGRTLSGWGLAPLPATETRPARPGFMIDYVRGRFRAEPRVRKFETREQPFAFVMRATNLLALDIDRHLDDGGADGFTGVRQLGLLPPTLAETSKSGAGRHLFYRVPDAWEQDRGFDRFDDVIGLVPGVDVRTTGCVYHYAPQRWNELPIADAPVALLQLLDERRHRKTTKAAAIAAAAANPDDLETLIMHDSLLTELNKPIASGKRNNSLFAIGVQMKDAGFPNWQDQLRRRAGELFMDAGEDEKIIRNIERQP